MRSGPVLISVVLLSAAAAACGGSTQNDLYGGKNGGSGGGYGQGGAKGGTGGATGGGGVSQGGAAGSAASGGGPTGGSAGAPAGGTGGVPTGGTGGVPTGGTGGMPMGGTGGMPMGGTGGTGGGTTDQVVHCGSSACTVPNNYCCQYVVSAGYSPTCLSTGQPCNQGSEAYCDGPEDCSAGDVCCGQIVQINNQNYYNVIKCTPGNQCDYQQNYRVFCNGNQGACPSGTTCKSSSILGDYQVCAAN
jgi:hypothetical protein